jgi:hypothetical protein
MTVTNRLCLQSQIYSVSQTALQPTTVSAVCPVGHLQLDIDITVRCIITHRSLHITRPKCSPTIFPSGTTARRYDIQFESRGDICRERRYSKSSHHGTSTTSDAERIGPRTNNCCFSSNPPRKRLLRRFCHQQRRSHRSTVGANPNVEASVRTITTQLVAIRRRPLHSIPLRRISWRFVGARLLFSAEPELSREFPHLSAAAASLEFPPTRPFDCIATGDRTTDQQPVGTSSLHQPVFPGHLPPVTGSIHMPHMQQSLQ